MKPRPDGSHPDGYVGILRYDLGEARKERGALKIKLGALDDWLTDVRIFLHCPNDKDLAFHSRDLSAAIKFALEELEGAESVTEFQDIVPRVIEKLRSVW